MTQPTVSKPAGGGWLVIQLALNLIRIHIQHKTDKQFNKKMHGQMADEVVFNQDNSEHKAAEFTWYSPIDGQPLVCAIGLSIMTLVLHPMESKQSPWKAAGRHCLKKHAGIAG